MTAITAHVTLIYSDHEYIATARSDSPDSFHNYIANERRPFGFGAITFNMDADDPRQRLMSYEMLQCLYDAAEESRGYDETMDAKSEF
tara:strand:- start:544 stop:807 length:264 start_codon:yes stop_codon:yes gene_type:complete